MTRDEAATLKSGDYVRVTVPGSGEVDFSDLGENAPEDWERHYEAGAVAVVCTVEEFRRSRQGLAITVTILEGPGRWVVNVFDEADPEPRFPFERLSGADLERARDLEEKSLLDIAEGQYEPCQLSPCNEG